ncbi:MARVEL domain-containing protein 2 isoform X1 [Mauremys reevesii]|uniref:MARVEL domain-containing protein 2 isoform X1 n=2 Tax=Mauremys reevesii TaxID=260615 RepID=UPI00193FEF48|nr:MARVEL domain-containing protein 2 isoform X1 [Mauremys reevesii]
METGSVFLEQEMESQMSSRSAVSQHRSRQHGRSTQYDEVFVDSSFLEDTASLPQSSQNAELLLSADRLPPPPLPLQPPLGPEFYPSNSEEPSDLKPVRRFIPDSWKNFFKGRRNNPELDKPSSDIKYTSGGVECSPPGSPVQQNHKSAASSYKDPYEGSGGSYNSRKQAEAMLTQDPYASLERHTQMALTYSEKVEAYNLRYSYMKSWAGLLRILCVVELLLGAAVFACVTAYIHKDNEWYNMFGYSQPYGFTANSIYGGYYYSGPKTPFILVVAGLAWVVTIALLVLGMSMYYRTILLDSNWWPLTEFGINVALFILYMAAAIVYVNDANRGGLCYYQLFQTPMNSSFCRIEGGQTAAMIFLFVTVIVYLISTVVCLKLWRHEGARRHRELMEQEMKTQSFLPQRMYESKDRPREEVNYKQFKSVEMKPELLNGHIPSGHIPKPIVMPDYLAKYPAIQTDDERDRYKAVFNDQYAEYKELSAEVQVVLKKFDDLDALMSKLSLHHENTLEHDRISKVLQEYKKKKNDPSFLEKKERCEYLKNKLSHIKQRIQDYDKEVLKKAVEVLPE